MSSSSTTSAGQPDFRSAVGRFFKSRTTTLLLINLTVAVFLSVLQPRFLNPENLASLFMGMTLVLILGGIDLSVGSVLALSGVVITMLVSNHVMSFPIPVPVAVLGWVCADILRGAERGEWMVITGFRAKLTRFLARMVPGLMNRMTDRMVADGLRSARP